MMPGGVVPGILAIAAWTLLSEVGAEFILTALTGLILIADPSYGIEFRTGYFIEGRW